MRTFLRAHWKALVAIVLLVVLALFTVTPGAAVPAPSLALRLHSHVGALLADGSQAAAPASPEQVTRYIENLLRREGYAVRHQEYRAAGQKTRNIEVSVANAAPDGKPARSFIVGARYDPAPGILADAANGSGVAAVLELARLLKNLHPSRGTEVKFVFVVNEEAPWLGGAPGAKAAGEAGGKLRGEGTDAGPAPHATGWIAQRRRGQMQPGMEGTRHAGNFIAYVGTLASSRQVQEALSAFRPASDFPAHGLATPAYVQGVTFSGQAADGQAGAAAIMITNTGFLRYPYYRTSDTDTPEDTLQGAPDAIDYERTARVVEGLARTLTALASAAQG